VSENLPSNERPDLNPPATQRSPAWIGGVVLILIGIVFLARNLTGFELGNWWALFILIPAFGSLAQAWRLYQSSGGRLTPAARGPLTGGLILLLVAAIFLFDVDWGQVWPVFLIVIGVGALFTSFSR